ncbi:MAG TPA: IS66 family transposase [Thermoanaerobaculia bacterium]|nr:IS66 family transposase [Thermoanaerobaculia bacterium]
MSGVEGVIAELQRELAALRREVAELRAENAQLRRLLDETRRGGKRQAAPFSKGAPKKDPKKPGRKAGSEYGRHSERSVPERIDETIEVPALVFCPHCSGPTEVLDVVDQYQIDLPPIVPQVTRFRIHRSRCRRCARIVMGRNPRQISDAVKIGRVHFGPRVMAFTAELNKVGGLSFGKISRFLSRAFHLELDRSTLVRMLGRLSRKAEPTYELLREQLREAAIVYPDETGWKIGGYARWLWAVTDQERTVYAIERGRGFAEAASILGENYAGIIGSDGWAPYQKFEQADRQTCLAHLLRRGRDLKQSLARSEDLGWLDELQQILQHGLSLRDRRDGGTITVHGLAIAKGLLEGRLNRLIRGASGLHSEVAKFARHLLRHRDEIFTFLDWPGLEATNWPSEHAIRMAVINRKNSGGNRTEPGGRTQAVLMSVLRTCHQQYRDAVEIVTSIMTPARPRPIEIAPGW